MDTQNQIFSDYSLNQSQTHSVSKSFMANVFLWMGGALLISAFFAWLFASNQEYMSYLQQETFKGKSLTTLGWAVQLSPIAFVFIMSLGFSRLSPSAMGALFIAYAAVTGISFSFILLYYTAGSVIGCFLSAAVMFIIMAVMGYTTSKDLTSFGRILIMALIGVVVASVINWFMDSAQMDYIISLVGVAVFTGLVAYDVQKLKRIAMGIELNSEGEARMVKGNTAKLSILGALNLYLDFINIFLFLIRLFGRRK